MEHGHLQDGARGVELCWVSSLASGVLKLRSVSERLQLLEGVVEQLLWLGVGLS